MYDLLIKHASVIDGTGSPAYEASVAVKDGKLVLSPSADAEAAEVVDAAGLVLCPGFIDSHSHGDKYIGTEVGCIGKTNQGITTQLTGQCGSTLYPLSKDPARRALRLHAFPNYGLPGWPDCADSLKNYRSWIEKQKMTVNLAVYCGHSALRFAVVGSENRKSTHEELEQMKELLREAMEHGALGLSSGLFYPPSSYADHEEMVELCKVVAEFGGVYATHMRNEAGEVLESVQKTIAVAEEAGCRLDISHHKICGKDNWGKSVQTLQLIREARNRGVDITLDLYPYTASGTGLCYCMPQPYFSQGNRQLADRLKEPALRQEIRENMLHDDGRYRHCGGWKGIVISDVPGHPELAGLSVEDYGKKLGKDPFDAYFDLMVETGCHGEGIFFSMCEEDMERIAADECAVFCTDDVRADMHSQAHPRSVAAFPCAIRHFVREKGLFSLEEMIRKITGLPADRFHLKGKGYIKNGYDADLVLFRADEITDRATYTDSLALCDGIERVIVAGETVWKDKKLTGKFPGTFVPGT